MGACNFEVFGNGNEASVAYRKLVDAATYEHGHNPYNGTIATTRGFEIRNSAKAMTMKEARAFADQDLDEAQKWGPAFCVRVVEANKDGWLFYGWAAE